MKMSYDLTFELFWRKNKESENDLPLEEDFPHVDVFIATHNESADCYLTLSMQVLLCIILINQKFISMFVMTENRKSIG